MLQEDQCMEMAILRQQGKSIRKIAHLLKISTNTVRKYLREGVTPGYSPRGLKPVKLDPYKEFVKARLHCAKPHWIPATVIYRELQAKGYTGKLRQLRYYMASLKPADRVEALVRFETEPGKQMQVDWAYFREGKIKLYAFIATLGYSRASYVEFTEDMTVETLLQCHIHALMHFEGVPEEILYDNMKTVVIERNAYGSGQHRLHPLLYDFAKHYGFVPKLCKPYRAQTKGKVERFIRYLRESFFVPLIATLRAAQLTLDKQTANNEVQRWLYEVANLRVHQTLQARPIDRLLKDQAALHPLPRCDHSIGAKERFSPLPLSAVKPMPVIIPHFILNSIP